MTSVVILQKTCASGKLLKFGLKYTIQKSFNSACIRNLNSIKKDPVLKNTYFFYVPKRSIYGLLGRQTKSQLKIKDGVPDQYTLIYRSTMDRYLLYSQLVTNATAFIAVLILLIRNDFSNTELDFSSLRSHPREVENEIFVYIAAFITMVAVLQIMISRLPLRIYNLPQQKKYIFVFHGNLPFTKRKLICKAGDVAQLPETGMMPWRDSRYFVKNEQKLILLEKYFRRPADLYIMLGVQKDHDVDETE